MFSTIRSSCYAASYTASGATFDPAEKPIDSTQALKRTLEELGYSYQAMQLFCSLDLDFLQELEKQDPLESILSHFQEHFCCSCVGEHLSKVFTHLGNFDKSYALISKITMASQAQSACNFLTTKMIASGLIQQAFDNIDSLHNLGSLQQSILENSALDQVLVYIESAPSQLLPVIDCLIAHFQQRRSRTNHENFWEKAYALCLASHHKPQAQACLLRIFSLKRQDSLLQEKK